MIDSVLHWLADWWFPILLGLFSAWVLWYLFLDIRKAHREQVARKAREEQDQARHEQRMAEIKDRMRKDQEQWNALREERQELERELRRRESVLRIKQLRSRQRSARRLVGG